VPFPLRGQINRRILSSVAIVLARSDVTAFIGSIRAVSLFLGFNKKHKPDIIRCMADRLARVRAWPALDGIKNGIRGRQRGYVT
jgi:hypothetical protein